jgi:5-methyltetrahydropteroyltriglutamate--homocysteine methyltransferase
LPVYEALLSEIAKLDEVITLQIDEPIFVKDLEPKILSLIKPTYDKLSTISNNIKIIVMSYFEHAKEATKILVNTPVYGIGLDFLYGEENFDSLDIIGASEKKLVAGVVDGRNIWKTDINTTIKTLETIAQKVKKENIFISSSCSLLHVPFSLKYEENMNSEIKNWLSYGVEKLDEISLISKLFFDGECSLNAVESVALKANKQANTSRKTS